MTTRDVCRITHSVVFEEGATMTPNSEQVEKDAKRVANIIIASIKEEENAEIREAILSELSEALSQPPTVTAEELAKNLTENYFPDELMRSGAIQMILRGISIATAPLQSEVTQLRKELETVKQASLLDARTAKSHIEEQEKEIAELTAEVERMKRECFTPEEAAAYARYCKSPQFAQNPMSASYWKASRGKGSGDQPNVG